ncbi:ShlB/FhaC/HecB family hemolysin secretion/activation protein [Crocosphaera sp. Alani8]|uniref:ShlB/FhaC/HecB family hemolysin secretion/activation protein n=1 Tax=Crocosphaera sp. Alani8 TaxID=3038952 RepID=UPI00313CAD80
MSDEQVNQMFRELLGKNISLEDIRRIEMELTEIYQKNGYLNTVVNFFPEDNRKLEEGKGIIVFRARESQVEIEIKGLYHLKKSYVHDRLSPYVASPPNINQIQEGLILLQQNDLISEVNARLIPGTKNNQVLEIDIRESPRWEISSDWSNEESPLIGEWGAEIMLSNKNLFGFGDKAQLQYKGTEGLERFLSSLIIPVNSNDGIIKLSYQFTNSEIIVAPFDSLEIRNESFTLSGAFQQPLIQTPSDKFNLGINVDHRESRSFLFNDFPFSFSENVRDGFTELTVLRFNQSYQTRDSDDVFSISSQLNIGWSNLINQSSFTSWQGQIQYVHLFNDRLRFSSRLSGQVGGGDLPTLEQCAIGGLNGNEFIFGNTVRGYATNVRSGDNCFALSSELLVTIIQDSSFGNWSLVPFIDLGTVSNGNSEGEDSVNTLISTGLGLRWEISDWLVLRLDYGVPLSREVNEIEEQRENFSIFLRIPL